VRGQHLAVAVKSVGANSVFVASVDQGHTVIFPRVILVYMENPCRDKMTVQNGISWAPPIVAVGAHQLLDLLDEGGAVIPDRPSVGTP
jgi:hypothetical protein